MAGSAQGGNDVLTGGNNSGSGSVTNFLIGDAENELFTRRPLRAATTGL